MTEICKYQYQMGIDTEIDQPNRHRSIPKMQTTFVRSRGNYQRFHVV